MKAMIIITNTTTPVDAGLLRISMRKSLFPYSNYLYCLMARIQVGKIKKETLISILTTSI